MFAVHDEQNLLCLFLYRLQLIVLPISSLSWTIVHIETSGHITLKSVMEEHCNTHRGDMRLGGDRIIAKLSLYICANIFTYYYTVPIYIIIYYYNTVCGYNELTYMQHSHICTYVHVTLNTHSRH